MSDAVEVPPVPSPADASAAWLATVASGLAIFAFAAGVALGLGALGEPLVRPLLSDALRHDGADVALAFAMLFDGATLLAALGLALLARRRDTSRSATSARLETWLAIALLVATCVGEHLLVATRTVVTRTLTLGPAGDPLWRTVAVDGRHLAWSIAVAVALRRVADVAEPRLARHARLAAIACPLVAAGVVIASRLSLLSGGPPDAVFDVPLWIAVVAELALSLWTIAIVASGEWRWIVAWRVARLRGDPIVDDRPADACVRCGYDLRGVADDAACPECGLLAGRSRTTAASHLRDASPAWLRGIAIGVSLVLLAELLGAAWPFVFDGVVMPNVQYRNVGWALLGVDVDLNLLLHAPAFGCAAILFGGVWLLTRPQRSGAGDDVLRGLLRTFAIVPLVAFAMTLWNHRAMSFRASEAIDLAALVLLTVGCAPIPALMFALLRRLAQRVLNANLAEHSTIVGVGLALTLLAIPPVAIVLGRFDIGRSDTSMFLLLAITVSFVLFAGWSVLNCIRFALAFRRAERESRALWQEADFGVADARHVSR